MPVDYRIKKEDVRYQRELYVKSAATRLVRDFLDRIALDELEGSGSVLDLGCGEGILLEKMASLKTARVCGVDLCRENVAICLGRGLPAVSADAARLPFASDSFEACVMTEVIEHLEPGAPEKVIAEIHRVLKKKGKLFVMFPNDRNYFLTRLMMLKFSAAFYNPQHTRQWVPSDARKLLENGSFLIRRSFSVPINFWPAALHHIIVGVKI